MGKVRDEFIGQLKSLKKKALKHANSKGMFHQGVWLTVVGLLGAAITILKSAR